MKQCAQCGEYVGPQNFRNMYEYRRARYCNKDCYLAAHKAKFEDAVCPICNTTFKRPANREQVKQFCSPKCQYKNNEKQGHKYVTPQGYVAIKVGKHPMAYSDGYILEHRLVMSQHLGRALATDEHIHHIDGNKQNNSIENLQIIENSEHQILHESSCRLNTAEAIEKRVKTRWGPKPKIVCRNNHGVLQM
jgi:hypothetical protein